jgi:hypothetical protein
MGLPSLPPPEARATCQDGIVPVHSIEHVQLAMPAGGEGRARWFYGDLLGLPEVPKPEHLVKRGGCRFETPTVKIHLGVDADFRPTRKGPPGAGGNRTRGAPAKPA